MRERALEVAGDRGGARQGPSPGAVQCAGGEWVTASPPWKWQDESEGPSLHIHLQLQRAMARALSSSPCLPPPSLSHPPVTLSTRLSRPLPSSLSHHLPLLSAELCVQPDAAWWVLASAAGAARSRFVFALLYSERHNTATKTQECAAFWIPLLYLLAFSSLGEGVIMNEMSGSEFDCRENA